MRGLDDKNTFGAWTVISDDETDTKKYSQEVHYRLGTQIGYSPDKTYCIVVRTNDGLTHRVFVKPPHHEGVLGVFEGVLNTDIREADGSLLLP